MSVSAISSNVNPSISAVRSPLAQQRVNFQALGKALQSNDLAGAQKAFGAGQANQSGQSSRDFQALARALQLGDLGGAQTAFAKLQQNAQKVQGHHHHRAGAVSPSGTSTGGSAAVAASAGARALGSTIDFKM